MDQSELDRVIGLVAERFPEHRVGASYEVPSNFGGILIPPKSVLEIGRFIKGEFPQLVDIFAVDSGQLVDRFCLYYLWSNPDRGLKICLKTKLGIGESLPSISSLNAGASWMEREVIDMFGVIFDSHPDSRRLYYPKSFGHYPLRKDFSWSELEKDQILASGVSESDDEINFQHLDERPHSKMYFGPEHPVTHGAVGITLAVDGDLVLGADVEVGFQHKGFEKLAEGFHYENIISLAERINIYSPLISAHGWCRLVEQVFDIVVPMRAQAVRMVLDELSRIKEHFIYLENILSQVGISFEICRQIEEEIFQTFKQLGAQNPIPSLSRIGGVKVDIDNKMRNKIFQLLNVSKETCALIDKLVVKSTSFRSRTMGLAPLNSDLAISYSVTGPNARASGIKHDIRRDFPYDLYSQVDFDLPLGANGDALDRFCVRLEEIHESSRIIRSLLNDMPAGPLFPKDCQFFLGGSGSPSHLADLIQAFMHVVEGPKGKAGEFYGSCEAPSGEFGFAIVSHGEASPYRVRCRPPDIGIVQLYNRLVYETSLESSLLILTSIHCLGGSLDR